MDVKKLMELNDNTDASTTDSSMRSPISTNVRHIREPSNIIEAISPVIGKQINDVDSIISDDEGDKATPAEESPVFNLSSEFHRPQLTKRKSSSFLNLFKKDKTKGARGSLDNLSKVSVAENTDTLHSDISTQPSTQSLVSKTSKPFSEESCVSCEIPSNITFDSNNVMLDTLVKVSHWKNNHWEFISSNWLQLQVVNSNQGRYMFVVQDDDSNLKLCVTIGERWSVSRTTAQDIQIRFPATDSVASVVAPVPALLSVRCPQVDNIVNVLKHCKKNEVISSSTDSMTKSSTQLTLQSNSSSILSSNIPDMSFSRSSTASNELSQSLSKSKVQDSNKNCKSLLLLSKVKVRLHKYDQNYGWKMSKVGLLNVYSRENNGSVVGCKFEMEDNESFTAQTSELKRLGRTGISAGESLVEFKNQAVTDEIYNLLSAL
ncbi:unnamed protein product [Kluyveromyces dobzhanskii CBS 2104]|uniref:WGS project CCBQ000000000 data, contig 00107 n=1 Tax=Kluyveromyces dobzhanskii CBS 2104 TaxID=1427455 RepID=A0A0A8L0P7_9SACH|nr:unnamed protein product [Kluyveromyces dobzhanskii CBS 2104]